MLNTEKRHEITLYVDQATLDQITKYLVVEPEDESECFGENSTISKTAAFGHSYEVDVKCCGVQYREGESNLAWTEAVLFHNGSEIACTEPCDEYEGEWILEDADAGATFVVNVKADLPLKKKMSEADRILASSKTDDEKLHEIFDLLRNDLRSWNNSIYSAIRDWDFVYADGYDHNDAIAHIRNLGKLFVQDQKKIMSWNIRLYYALLGWKDAHLRDLWGLM